MFKDALLFYKSGLSQMPIPMQVSMWMAVLLMYLIGMTYVFYQWVCGRNSVLIAGVFYISILGAGLFTYYEYRAHPFNLMAVSWPVILLGFIFSSMIFQKIKQAKLGMWAMLFVVPFICLTIFISEIYLYSIPYLCKKSMIIWRAMQQPDGRSKLTHDYLFIKQKIGNSKNVAVLINGQGVLFDKLGIASAIDGPSNGELFLQSDYSNVTKQLLAKPVQHVFIDRNSKWLSALLLKYTKEDITQDGTWYLVPKRLVH